MAIFDAGKSVPDIVHLQYVALLCTSLGFVCWVRTFLLLLLKLILGVGVGEWYVGCEEVLDGCWCWWVKGGGGGGY